MLGAALIRSSSGYNLDEDPYLKSNYYDNLAKKRRSPRSLIHRERYLYSNRLVEKYYSPGKTVIDFACGNCSWNLHKIPVIDIDSSTRMLEFCLRDKRTVKALCEDITKETTLYGNQADSARVITETLEHLKQPDAGLREIFRVLKSGGVLIASVPYDTLFSLWRPLFGLLCFFQGIILGKKLSQNKCGHINSFSQRSLRLILERNGFKILEQSHIYRLFQFAVARKSC